MVNVIIYIYIVNNLPTYNSSNFKYYQDNLVPGQHTLVLSGDSTPPAGSSIDLDSITVFAATGVSASMPSTSTYVNVLTIIFRSIYSQAFLAVA